MRMDGVRGWTGVEVEGEDRRLKDVIGGGRGCGVGEASGSNIAMSMMMLLGGCVFPLDMTVESQSLQ